MAEYTEEEVKEEGKTLSGGDVRVIIIEASSHVTTAPHNTVLAVIKKGTGGYMSIGTDWVEASATGDKKMAVNGKKSLAQDATVWWIIPT